MQPVLQGRDTAGSLQSQDVVLSPISISLHNFHYVESTVVSKVHEGWTNNDIIQSDGLLLLEKEETIFILPTFNETLFIISCQCCSFSFNHHVLEVNKKKKKDTYKVPFRVPNKQNSSGEFHSSLRLENGVSSLIL